MVSFLNVFFEDDGDPALARGTAELLEIGFSLTAHDELVSDVQLGIGLGDLRVVDKDQPRRDLLAGNRARTVEDRADDVVETYGSHAFSDGDGFLLGRNERGDGLYFTFDRRMSRLVVIGKQIVSDGLQNDDVRAVFAHENIADDTAFDAERKQRAEIIAVRQLFRLRGDLAAEQTERIVLLGGEAFVRRHIVGKQKENGSLRFGVASPKRELRAVFLTAGRGKATLTQTQKIRMREHISIFGFSYFVRDKGQKSFVFGHKNLFSQIFFVREPLYKATFLCYNEVVNERKAVKIMGNIWHDMREERIQPENFVSVIEITKGSKKKYELDKECGLLRLDRILYTSTHYPANYGFIPRTYGDDGDPLDVLVLCSESIDPMTIVECYPIGVITMMDNGRSDEKIIAIPFNDPNYNMYTDITQLPFHIFEEMRHFFTVYKALEHKETAVKEVQGKEEAIEIINQCIERYKEIFLK